MQALEVLPHASSFRKGRYGFNFLRSNGVQRDAFETVAILVQLHNEAIVVELEQHGVLVAVVGNLDNRHRRPVTDQAIADAPRVDELEAEVNQQLCIAAERKLHMLGSDESRIELFIAQHAARASNRTHKTPRKEENSIPSLSI